MYNMHICMLVLEQNVLPYEYLCRYIHTYIQTHIYIYIYTLADKRLCLTARLDLLKQNIKSVFMTD